MDERAFQRVGDRAPGDAVKRMSRRTGTRLSAPLGATLCALFAFTVGACGEDTPTGPPPAVDLAVLFIGNSLTYSNDLPEMLEHLLVEYGEVGTVYVESVALPNFGLQDHWAGGTARARIAEGGWDVVIVQQGPSATEGRPSLIEYSARFADEVRAVGGDLAVYMVWPSIQRFDFFQRVSDSHVMAAEEADALLYPVGEAWRSAFDREQQLDLYSPDGVHPNIAGTYLAALVMFEQLTGVTPSSLPDGLITPDEVIPLLEGMSELLHESAEEANAEFAISAR